MPPHEPTGETNEILDGWSRCNIDWGLSFNVKDNSWLITDSKETKGVIITGKPPFSYINSPRMDISISDKPDDVDKAISDMSKITDTPEVTVTHKWDGSRISYKDNNEDSVRGEITMFIKIVGDYMVVAGYWMEYETSGDNEDLFTVDDAQEVMNSMEYNPSTAENAKSAINDKDADKHNNEAAQANNDWISKLLNDPLNKYIADNFGREYTTNEFSIYAQMDMDDNIVITIRIFSSKNDINAKAYQENALKQIRSWGFDPGKYKLNIEFDEDVSQW